MQVTNLNGRPGLAFASYPLCVLTTSAPGNFSEASYSAGAGPIALGDFNGDGRQDLVAANNRGVEVLLNTGATGVLRAPLDVTLSLMGPPKITSINTTDSTEMDSPTSRSKRTITTMAFCRLQSARFSGAA